MRDKRFVSPKDAVEAFQSYVLDEFHTESKKYINLAGQYFEKQ